MKNFAIAIFFAFAGINSAFAGQVLPKSISCAVYYSGSGDMVSETLGTAAIHFGWGSSINSLLRTETAKLTYEVEIFHLDHVYSLRMYIIDWHTKSVKKFKQDFTSDVRELSNLVGKTFSLPLKNEIENLLGEVNIHEILLDCWIN